MFSGDLKRKLWGFIHKAIAIALLTIGISGVVSPAAHAAVPPNGTYNCITGLASAVTPTFTITNGVVSLATGCNGAVMIPDGVTSIGSAAFQSSALTSISLPNSLTLISDNAFNSASGITSITIPHSVTIIGENAFLWTPLTSVTVTDTVGDPSQLILIKKNAFMHAQSLADVNIPNSVLSILADAFLDTPALTSYRYCGVTTWTLSGLVGKTKTCVTTPGAPTIGTATSTGATTATVAFSAPVSNGGSTILAYNATSNPGSITATLTQAGSGTISITGLTAGTAYTFTVIAHNIAGDSSASAASNSITSTPPAPVIVYVPPTPVPYLKTLTTPKLNLSAGKLACTPGTYNAGYTLDGLTQSSTTTLFTPSSFVYNLLINGVAQSSLAATSSSTSNSWSMPASTSGALITCSVTVTVNGVTNTDKSSDNTSGASSALSTQSTAIETANAEYSALQTANSKAYQKALIDSRTTWRGDVEKNRAAYFAELNRIASLGASKSTHILTSAALKNYITTQKKIAADYKASQPAAAAARGSANKAALATRDAAIAKAKAAYGIFIESIGYGVLIP